MTEKTPHVLALGGRASTGFQELGYFARDIERVFGNNGVEYFFLNGGLFKTYQNDEILRANCFQNVSAVIYLEKDGTRLMQVAEWCQEFQKPLVVLATGFDLGVLLGGKKITLIEAPNIDLNVLRKIKSFKQGVRPYLDDPKKYRAYITEAHQSGKKSVPGTAKVLQEILGDICHPQIASIRDPRIAEMLGVPKYDLRGFGLHIVEIFDISGDKEKRVFKEEFYVAGRDSYAFGLIELLKIIPSLEKDRKYHINDIVDEGLLG